MMSVNDLNLFVGKEYTLKCFVDLAQVTNSPTEIYKHFESCYQQVFNNNDRLVFYTTDAIPDQLLIHLYRAAELIDISNFFVLICSPHNIRNQLQSVANSIGQGAFGDLQISFDCTKKLQSGFQVSETLCPMPWRHLAISNKGHIRPCCIHINDVGNVNKSSLNDAFYSSTLFNLRRELLLGKKPRGCQHCWNLEDKGLISNRVRHMNLLKKQLLTVDLDQPSIKSLDISPGNTCNFKCRICGPSASSLFAQEVNKLQGIAAKTVNWAEETSVVINEISDLLPNLTNLDMYGGEPFLIKPLGRLISQAARLENAKHLRLHYNSNGSVYPKDLIEHWKKFKHVDIQFSIDNIGARFELERGGSWHDIESNIKKLLSLNMPNIKISIMPAISIMNILYIDELLIWAADLKLLVNPLYVSSPAGFALENLTCRAKNLIINKFKNHPWPEMQNIITHLESIPDSDGIKFIQTCQHFDAIRNQNFSSSHPEIAEAMGYVYNKTI